MLLKMLNNKRIINALLASWAIVTLLLFAGLGGLVDLPSLVGKGENVAPTPIATEKDAESSSAISSEPTIVPAKIPDPVIPDPIPDPVKIADTPSIKTLFSTDDYKQVEYSNPSLTHADVMILVSIAGEKSYGPDRSFESLYDTLKKIQTEKHTYSLGFLLSSNEEYDHAVKFIEDNALSRKEISRIVLVQAPFLDNTFQVDDSSRQHEAIQGERRRLIARVRNFLISTALRTETYTLFIDADILRIKNAKNFLSTFIDSKLDIIVPRIIKGENQDYDKNSWRGERTKPTTEQLTEMDAKHRTDYVPRDVGANMYHFDTYMRDTELLEKHGNDPLYTVPLDSVGGAILFAKSIIYKQGIVFPINYIIGATWDRYEGYDGIETEGLCYLARPAGYSCWGMPNQVAYHVPH